MYRRVKKGGNQRLTEIKKVTGNVILLRDELQRELGLEKNDIVLNWLTKHIIVKVGPFESKRDFTTDVPCQG